MNFFSVFSILVLVFLDLAGACPSISSNLDAYLKHS